MLLHNIDVYNGLSNGSIGYVESFVETNQMHDN